jgi:hypothetical protein
MRNATLAGLAYFAWVFAIAFAVGIVRVLVVAPALGATAAVLLELPIILAVSWWSCGVLLRRFAIGPALRDRLIMGLTAFVVLQAAEAVLAVTAFGRSPAAYLAGFTTLAGQLGLAGQIGFALIPLVRRRG